MRKGDENLFIGGFKLILNVFIVTAKGSSFIILENVPLPLMVYDQGKSQFESA